jgi:hypothetical protein
MLPRKDRCCHTPRARRFFSILLQCDASRVWCPPRAVAHRTWRILRGGPISGCRADRFGRTTLASQQLWNLNCTAPRLHPIPSSGRSGRSTSPIRGHSRPLTVHSQSLSTTAKRMRKVSTLKKPPMPSPNELDEHLGLALPHAPWGYLGVSAWISALLGLRALPRGVAPRES